MGLGSLTAVIDELAADPEALSDGESLMALQRQMDRLEALRARANAAFDASRAWESDGARSAAGWMAHRCRMAGSTARRQLALGRVLAHLPAAGSAWSAGDIGAGHVSVLAGVRRPSTEERLAQDEATLVAQAKGLSFSGFVRMVAYWAQHADPDGEDQSAEAQRDGRRLHLSQSIGGIWFGDLRLDPISGTIVSKELSRLEKAAFEADWAEAKARLGRDPNSAELGRTPAQRRADALVEMAVRSRTAPATGRRPEPLFTVLVGWETLAGRICELADGTVVAPGAVIPWLGSAWLERVVFDGPSRVIDVGVTRRLFTGATRRAVEVRDRQCFNEYCEEPGERCQADHVVPYAAGGLTTQANGRLACGFHNRGRHRRPESRGP